MAENPEAIAGLRAALEDLTARVSDLSRDTEGLAREVFAENFDGLDADEAVALMVNLVTGYGNVALRLVVDFAKKTDRSTDDILAWLGTWVNRIEAEAGA